MSEKCVLVAYINVLVGMMTHHSVCVFVLQMNTNDFMKNVESIMQGAEIDATSDSPAVVLKIFLAGGDRSVSEIKSELKRLQLSRGLDEPQKIKVKLYKC